MAHCNQKIIDCQRVTDSDILTVSLQDSINDMTTEKLLANDISVMLCIQGDPILTENGSCRTCA